MDARQYFAQEVQQPEEQIDLAEAALYIAQEEYPDLDPLEYLNALDTMATEVRERLPAELYPLRILQCLNRYFYENLGFSGNTSDYYDPRNSYLNEVLNRRTGIPITLALVYLEVARRIDFPMVGVGTPGHFLIRPDFDESGIFVDAFNAGEILFAEECAERMAQVYGRPVAVAELAPLLRTPVGPRAFLGRMVTNLKMIYATQQDFPRALAAIERLLLLFPEAALELRDRGLIHHRLGHWAAAAADLTAYLAGMPTARDVPMLTQLLASIRQHL
ncbi:SirB1 family protein [Anthocerotibacter panamensis]|uniref:SirB1 family protein n=1 Tax=Anthocerotibacter panamensis TaxID=2857077 RepID=UPI001C405D7D|nr:tetratricopeptide repeat protein [Anthocerotibacter panamensis]